MDQWTWSKNRRVLMKSIENRQQSMQIKGKSRENPEISMESLDTQWTIDKKLMNIDANQRESVKIDENQWKLTKINGLGEGFWYSRVSGNRRTP